MFTKASSLHACLYECHCDAVDDFLHGHHLVEGVAGANRVPQHLFAKFYVSQDLMCNFLWHNKRAK